MTRLICCIALAGYLAACAPSTPREIDYPELAVPPEAPQVEEAGTPTLDGVPVEEAEVIEADTTTERQGHPLPPDDGR